jgi:hypothetical protein
MNLDTTSHNVSSVIPPSTTEAIAERKRIAEQKRLRRQDSGSSYGPAVTLLSEVSHSSACATTAAVAPSPLSSSVPSEATLTPRTVMSTTNHLSPSAAGLATSVPSGAATGEECVVTTPVVHNPPPNPAALPQTMPGAGAMEDIVLEFNHATKSAMMGSVNATATPCAQRLPTGPIPPTTSQQQSQQSLPSAFLAMPETKLQYAESIALYVKHHHALAAAKTELENFKVLCSKNAPFISLPASIRPTFSKAYFPLVEDDAAFNKKTVDALKTLEQESAKAAFELIVAGKKKFIDHLQSLVKAQSFIASATATYSTFIHTTNKLYANCGSSTVIPLQPALAHFEKNLHSEMETFVTQQVQRGFAASRQQKNTADEAKDAEERIIAGSHNGTNIAQIATKAAETRLVQTNHDLHAINTQLSARIMSLELQVNKFAHATAARTEKKRQMNTTAVAQKKRKIDHAVSETVGLGTEETHTIAGTTSGSNDQHMRDIELPTGSAPPRKASNFPGGGRLQQRAKKELKKQGHGKGNEGNAPTKKVDTVHPVPSPRSGKR